MPIRDLVKIVLGHGNGLEGKCVNVLEGPHAKKAQLIATLADGTLVSSSYDRTIRLWRNGEPVNQVDTDTGYTIRSLAALPSGGFAATSERGIQIWNNGAVKSIIYEDHKFRHIIALSDSILAASCYNSYGLLVLDVEKGGRPQVLVDSVGRHDECLVALPNGLLASGGYDNIIRIWELDMRCSNEVRSRCIGVLEGHTDSIFSIAVRPDGLMASGSYDDTIRIWRCSNEVGGVVGGEVAYKCVSILEGYSDEISAVVFLLDGNLASGSSDQTICVWNVDTGRCLMVLEGHTCTVSSLAVLSDGALASASDDGTIRIWD